MWASCIQQETSFSFRAGDTGYVQSRARKDDFWMRTGSGKRGKENRKKSFALVVRMVLLKERERREEERGRGRKR